MTGSPRKQVVMKAQATPSPLVGALEALIAPPDGEPAERPAAAAVEIADALIRWGWTPPAGLRAGWQEHLPDEHAGGELPRNPVDPAVLTELVAGPALRSLTEDFAVERARQDGLSDHLASTRARAAAARERSQHLASLIAAERPGVARTTPPARGGPGAAEPALPAPPGSAPPDPDPVETELTQLRYALANRPATEHAVGMIMLALACGPKSAWRTMVELSQATNRPVREIAASMAVEVRRGDLRPQHLALALDDLKVSVPEDEPPPQSTSPPGHAVSSRPAAGRRRRR